MSDRKGQAKATPSDSREALLQAARRVFASKGFEGATVKDLADEAGVNVSLVSYHFGGKENLYRECMENFGVERVEAAERLLKDATSQEEFKLRLKLFAEDFINIHLTQPDTCKMIHRGLDSMDPISADLFKSVFIRMYQAVLKFVEAAQRNGIIKEGIDTEITAGLMFGALMNMVRFDDARRLVGKRTLDEPAFREAVTEHWVANYIEGILK